MNRQSYLGDGVYVEIESGMLKIWTERKDETHFIFMEPEVLNAFLEYVKKLQAGKDAI